MIDDLARGLILGRIRDALGTPGESVQAAHERIVRDYTQRPTLSRDACAALFVERLEHYQVGVHCCAQTAIAPAIAAALAARRKSRLLVPADIEPAWLPREVEFVADTRSSFRQLDESEGVLTGCSLAIASTGTIILRHAAGEGRRALTLIPDYHLCVVLDAQLVETVPEAFRRLTQWKPAVVTTISGPSATSDIEMTRIRGVHGPRTLDIVFCRE